MPSNIHTLATTKKKIKRTPTTHYPKDESYYMNIDLWKIYNDDIGFSGTIMPVPIDPDTKNPPDNILFKKTHGNGVWSFSKLQEWIDHKLFEDKDYHLGCLIEGDVGVLDFDTPEDFNWFIDTFNIRSDEYLIYSSGESHSGGGHIWFKQCDYFLPLGRKVRFLLKEDGTRRDMEFLSASVNKTPQVVKVPMGYKIDSDEINGKKKWVSNCFQPLVLKTLPQEFIDHCREYRYIPRSELDKKGGNNIYIDLASCLNKHDFKNGEFNSCVRELYSMGVKRDEIYNWTKHLPQSMEYPDHKKYLYAQISKIEQHPIIKSFYTLKTLAEQSNPHRFMEWDKQYWDRGTKNFDSIFLQTLSKTQKPDQDKKTIAMRYFNHFFRKITGKDCGVYLLKFDENGIVMGLDKYESESKFYNYCGVNIWYDGRKGINCARWWFEHTNNTYNDVVYKPYGILYNNNYNPLAYNLFSGYKMKYDPEYNDPTYNVKGDLIASHLREVLCDGNMEVYKWQLKWYQMLICQGIRPGVMIVYYSKEHGVGKGMWIENLMKHVIGEENSSKNCNFIKMMGDGFTDYYDKCSLFVLEELPENSGKAKDQWDVLKSLVTDTKRSGRGFHKAPSKVDNELSIVALTNHEDSVDPDFVLRRGQANQCSPKYLNNIDYFDRLNSACGDYKAWSNFVHRYLIQQYDDIKDIRVQPTEELIPMTKYRQTILKKKINNLLYFFKDMIFDDDTNYDEDHDDPHHRIRGRWVYIKDCFTDFKEFVLLNNLPDWCKSPQMFMKHLRKQLNPEVRNVVPIGTTSRSHKGHYFELNDAFIEEVTKQIHKYCIGDDLQVMRVGKEFKKKIYQHE